MDGRKEVEAILREANSRGWIVTPTGHGHAVANPADPKNRVFLGSTPSDGRALKNIMARLRHRGWDGKGLCLPPEDQIEILRAECAGLEDERSAALAELSIMTEAQDDVAGLRRKVKAALLEVQHNVSERDLTISKLRRQVEDWRQKWNYSEKSLAVATDFYRAVARLLGMKEDPEPGCIEEAVRRIKKKDEHIEEGAEELASFLRLVYDGLDRVGAPSEVVEDAGVRTLTTEERFATLGGENSEPTLRLELIRTREAIRLHAASLEPTIASITDLLGDRG